MSRQTQSSLLLAVAILFALLAAVTVVPYPTAMVSDLGYHTVCPFAPWSTLTLLFVGWMAWVLRGYINQEPK